VEVPRGQKEQADRGGETRMFRQSNRACVLSVVACYAEIRGAILRMMCGPWVDMMPSHALVERRPTPIDALWRSVFVRCAWSWVDGSAGQQARTSGDLSGGPEGRAVEQRGGLCPAVGRPAPHGGGWARARRRECLARIFSELDREPRLADSRVIGRH
jgi:hypothetical protein